MTIKKRTISIIIILLAVISLFLLKIKSGFIPIPIWLRHSINLIVAPKNLYKPIVFDKFHFWEKGFTNTYLLKPKYLDSYDISIFSERGDLPVNFKFKGSIRVDFFEKGNLISQGVLNSIVNALYANNDMKHYKKISLGEFKVPLKGKYVKDISVKLTVLEPDEKLKKYEDSIKLYIAVSSVP